MKRRELLVLVGGAMVAPRPLRPQQKSMPAVGYLGLASPGSSAPFVAAFRRGLSETGWAEGQSVAIEYRWAEGHPDRLPALAADLVGHKVEVIASSGNGALAAKSATSTIPIVFTTAGGPQCRSGDDWREFAVAGGLISYGPSRTATWHQCGVYVGKILNGARPMDLPVEQPTTFELVVNLKTAKALGLTVPPSILAHADEVVE